MLEEDFRKLNEVCERWSERLRPTCWPVDVPLRRLPRPTYLGDNSYNGFTGAERRRGDQVLQVLRKQGVVPEPETCDICGTTGRVGYHGENYFDPFSMAPLCFSCHMALHRRFRSPEKWFERLDQHADNPKIEDFHLLPMVEPDFARWLRENTDGPHDMAKRVWGDREVLDYVPRKQAGNHARDVRKVDPRKTEIRTVRVTAKVPEVTQMGNRIGILSQVELKRFVAAAPPWPPRTTALEQRIRIGTGFHGKWYRSQQEHWLGWLAFQDARAEQSGKNPHELPASAIWNRLKCSPMMYWLAEVSGVSPATLVAAEAAAIRATEINPVDGNPHGRLMREILPWDCIVVALSAGPARLPEAEAKASGLAALQRLASLRSEFRPYLPQM